MATTSTRRLTRADREAARRAAASANAAMDLRPVGRAAVVVAAVIGTIVLLAVFVPGGRAFGGPLQSDRLEQGSSLTTVRNTKGARVTFEIPVAWNAGSSAAVLEALVPLEADGVEVVRVAVVPLGQPAVASGRGFPPPTAVLEALEGYPVPQGTGPVDGFQVVAGLSGTGSVPAFALAYRVGEIRHVAILGHGVVVCPKACGDPVRAPAQERQRGILDLLARFVASPVR